ncbi:hypothetical protein IQ241_15920 [Romeria aff. gracilis LEGE 07310]|uniref:Tetratricopeptide repeat protein n=1 Tax=Vasconcelosia minhoensis LEGE 07310 TaxID=915328 RepID=A0A8J7AP83_9CYAN|nr:tetratricopeptide repeat protein [Romeria gracilis]MBE9078765.1 hypothetical protein [Romeria aff. gracilis LEGE 07310]
MIAVSDFLVWAIVILAVAGIGIGAMTNAYFKPLGGKIPFPLPIEASATPLSGEAQAAFEQGVKVFQGGDYRGAIARFTQVSRLEPSCAEAFHNLGLAQVNVGDDNQAVRSLLQASERYDRQGSKDGIDQVKQQLIVLKQSAA